MKKFIYIFLIIAVLSLVFTMVFYYKYKVNRLIIADIATSTAQKLNDIKNDLSTTTNSVSKDNSVSIKKDRVEILSNNLATWLWDSPVEFNDIELTKMFEIAYREKITNIYLRMDDYIDVYSINDEVEKTKEINKLDYAAERFINLAKKYNIKVQALGGDSGWANKDEIEMAIIFFDAVVKYNQKYPSNKFTGIQFDVESNNSEYYKEDKNKAIIDYLNFVQMMVNRKKDNSMIIGFAVPILYGRDNNPDAKVIFDSKGEKLIIHHILDILNQKPNTYVALMDYRNFAEGVDGSIYYADILMRYINENSLSVKLVVGQETDDVKPSKITFYGTSKKHLKIEVNKIIDKFSSYPGFDGIAIHHIKSFIDL